MPDRQIQRMERAPSSDDAVESVARRTGGGGVTGDADPRGEIIPKTRSDEHVPSRR